MGIWLQTIDLQRAVSSATVIACFNEDNTDTPDQSAIDSVISRAEHEMMSWLSGEYGPPPFNPTVMAQLAADPFLKSCALEYAIAFTFDRHPEYVRSSGKDRGDRFKRADERMERVMDGIQRPATVPKKPANVGGVLVDNANRIYVDNPDGTQNSGDY